MNRQPVGRQKSRGSRHFCRPGLKIERAPADVSLDQLVMAYVALGGAFTVKPANTKAKKGKPTANSITFEMMSSKRTRRATLIWPPRY